MCLAALVACADAGPAADGCQRIKDAFDAQYITYERAGVARPDFSDESRERLWFRFHNNTTCRLRIPASAPVAIRTLPDGRRTADVEEGQEVGMALELTDARTGQLTFSWGPNAGRAIIDVPAGRSVVFSVAASRVKVGPMAVRFNYSWESAGASVRHRVLYDPNELPPEVRNGLP